MLEQEFLDEFETTLKTIKQIKDQLSLIEKQISLISTSYAELKKMMNKNLEKSDEQNNNTKN